MIKNKLNAIDSHNSQLHKAYCSVQILQLSSAYAPVKVASWYNNTNEDIRKTEHFRFKAAPRLTHKKWSQSIARLYYYTTE